MKPRILVESYLEDLAVEELTFFDGSGFDLIEPKEWDEEMGSWIHLPM